MERVQQQVVLTPSYEIAPENPDKDNLTYAEENLSYIVTNNKPPEEISKNSNSYDT